MNLQIVQKKPAKTCDFCAGESTCKICGRVIGAGKPYFEMDCEYYHDNCFEENAVKILMEECGAIKNVALPPEPTEPLQ